MMDWRMDPVRLEIMRLEAAQEFDEAAWKRILRVLEETGRAAGLEDAARRMLTARRNARMNAQEAER